MWISDAPLLSQPLMLKITGLKAATLQTWVNRGHIKLPTKNPGRGKSRLYSKSNCVVASILRRTDDLGLPLALGLDLANSVIADYAKKNIPSDLCIYLDAQTMWVALASGISSPRLYRYRWTKEPSDATTIAQALSKAGGEPVIVFPIGKIVEKTQQLLMDEAISSLSELTKSRK